MKELRFAIAVGARPPHNLPSQFQATKEYADTEEELERKINDFTKGLTEVKAHGDKHVAQFVHQFVSDYLIQSGLNILTDETEPADRYYAIA